MSTVRAVAAVLLALLAGPAIAQPPSDMALERQAVTALAADPRLTGLTVSVVDRVAVVGGPVPDAAAKRSADAAVRSVNGLAAVRLNCWVPLAPDPYAERVRERLAPAKPAVAPPWRPEPPGELLPLALPLPGSLPPPPSAPPTPEPVTAAWQGADRRGWLLSPVAGSTIPPAGVPAVPPARFARLTAADPRFRRLTVDVSPAGVATIGGVGDPAAGWELAEVVRHQPGVTRVVVGDIRER